MSTLHAHNGHDEVRDELPAAVRERVESHLASCGTCQLELAAWRSVSAAVHRLGVEEPEPSPDVLAGALARVEPREPTPSPHTLRLRRVSLRPAWVRATLAVAACPAVALVLVARPDRSGDTPIDPRASAPTSSSRS